MKSLTCLVSGVVGWLLVGGALGETPEPSPRLVSAPPPAFPARGLNAPIYEGIALVGCLVAPDGSVTEAWTFKASHRVFAEAAEEAVRKWRYEPVAGTGGRAQRIDAVEIQFSASGALVLQTQFDAMKSAFQGFASATPPVLDEWPSGEKRPARISGGRPKVRRGQPGGMVEVEFFVDSTGRVRLPVALRSSHPELAEAALTAVRNWRFEAPRVANRPVSVRTRWVFNFPNRDS